MLCHVEQWGPVAGHEHGVLKMSFLNGSLPQRREMF